MSWLRRIRGAVGMGVTWALLWALSGIAIGLLSFVVPAVLSGPFFRAFDAPLPALAIPGFFGGLFFSAVLGIAGHHRRFRDLSLPKFTAWGAFGGLLLSVLPALLIAVGLATPAQGVTGLSIFGTVAVPFVLLGGASAAATLAVARIAERKDLPAPEIEREHAAS